MDALSFGVAGERSEAEALLLLQRIPGLADRGIGRLVASFGSGRGALAACDREFTAGDRAAVAEALDRADAIGARVVPLGSSSYPTRLHELVDPPPVLFLRGREALLEGPAVAVVGSRRATGYGRRTAVRLAEALARAGVVVVSGFALGVDGEAHQGALTGGGGTIAVLGSGPDVVHPRAHARIFRDLLRRGLIVSEFPPGTGALPHHFPRRNRIMAALAHAVVVVEAAARSGALITARHALDLGREVLAVPGPIDAPTSAGANALIRDGAQPVLGPEDVFRALDLPVPAASAAAPPAGDASAVWAALDAAPIGVDEVTARCGLDARRALAALSLLELDGWAVQTGGARFARRG